MRLSMLSQALSGPGNSLIRDCLRAGTPALISMFIDVAMIAGKIAPAVHFEHNFTEGDQGSCHSVSLATLRRDSESRAEG